MEKKIYRNINIDAFYLTPSYEPEFIAASEEFGGALEIRHPDNLGLTLEKEFEYGLRNTRLYTIAPLNVVQSIIDELNYLSANLLKYNSNLKLGYIKSSIPNAQCWKSKNLTFIGVTSGLVHYIHGTVSHLLSFPEFLPKNFENNEEISGDITKLRDAINLNKLFNFNNERELIHTLHRSPRHKERQIAVIAITHLAIIFTFLHEIGHYYYRHIDFISNKFNRTLVNEIFGSEKDDDGFVNLFQRFELFADEFAIEFMFNKIIHGKLFKRNLEYYFLFSLSIDLLLWMFGHKKERLMTKAVHPHPYLRILNKLQKLSKYQMNSSFKIEKNNHNSPYVVFSANDACLMATTALRESWKLLSLPGIDCFFTSGIDATDIKEAHQSVKRKESKIWLAYEEYVTNNSIVDEARKVLGDG